MSKINVLFVCSGNICRSPTAEGVFRHLIKKQKLEHKIETDSVGFESYHVGEAPDKRAQKCAAQRGYDLSDLRARRIAPRDFILADLILAMDRGHLSLLKSHAPEKHQHKIHLFLEYSTNVIGDEVPDPYYGSIKSFEHTLDLVENGAKMLLQKLQEA